MKTAFLVVSLLALSLGAAPAASNFKTFQAASVVLGQPDFTTNANVPGQPNRTGGVYSVATDPTTGKVFVADYGHNRVLRFSSAAAAQNGANPEAVFGQLNFTAFLSNQGSLLPTASTLNSPCGVSVDSGGRLWIADYGNNRVLGFYLASHLGTGAPADIVLGQPDFTSNTPDRTQSVMNSPIYAMVGPGDVLWVCDFQNNRVLRFDSISTKTATGGANADAVLGQADFTSNDLTVAANRLKQPAQAWADAVGRLWVADSGNNRVLRFNGAAALASNSNASVVLGQPDFTMATPATSLIKMAIATGVYFDGSDLWVCDSGNNRVLRFSAAASLTSGSGADLVLGQAGFNASMPGLSAQNLNVPWNISPGLNNSLWVSDSANNRALRFDPLAAPQPRLRVTVSGRKSFSTPRARVMLRGTARAVNGQLRAVQVKVGRTPYRNAIGKAKWRFAVNLKPGRNIILIRAVDVSKKMSSSLRVVITREPQN